MKLIKNVFYNMSYQIFVLIVPLITLPYVSRVLGPTAIGINAYTNTIAQYFVLLSGLGIQLLGNREIAYRSRKRGEYSQKFFEILFLRIVLGVISLGAYFLWLTCTNNLNIYTELQSLLIIASILDVSWFFMGLEEFRITVVRNFIVKLISIVLIFILIKSSKDLDLYIFIIAFSQLAGNMTLWMYLLKWIDFRKFKTYYLNFVPNLLLALGLFIPQIANQLYVTVNKSVVGALMSVKYVGFFESADKIDKIALTVITSAGTVLFSRIAQVFSEGDESALNKYLAVSVHFVNFLSFPFLMGLIGISQNFPTFFFGAGYSQVGPLMAIEAVLVVVVSWNNVLGAQYLIPTKKTRLYSLSIIGGLIVDVATLIPFVHLLGVAGAVVSTVIAEMVATLIQFYYASKYVNFLPFLSDSWKYFLASVPILPITLGLSKLIQSGMLLLGVQILLSAVVYFMIIWILKPSIFGDLSNLKGE